MARGQDIDVRARSRWTAACTLALAASCAATPGDEGAVPAEEPATRVAIGPLLWLASLEGALAASGDDGSDADVEDPLALDSGIMGALEVDAGPWTFLADGLYVEFVGSAEGPGGLPSEVSIEAVIVSLSAARELARWPLGAEESGVLALDGYAGARLAGVELGVETESLGGGDADRTWVDPLVGLRASASWSERLALRLAGDVGGFGVGSDLVWQASGAVDWRPWRHFGFAAGYRVLDYDFDDEDPGDTLRFDVQLRGPFLALLASF